MAGVSTSATVNLIRTVKHLVDFAHPGPDYFECRVERKFQTWLKGRLSDSLGERYKVLGEARTDGHGGGIKPIRTFGSGSWPDVTVVDSKTNESLAIELKCLWKRGLPNRVAHALGQAFLYLERDDSGGGYDNALVVFFVVEAIPFRIPPGLETRLETTGISVSTIRSCELSS